MQGCHGRLGPSYIPIWLLYYCFNCRTSPPGRPQGAEQPRPCMLRLPRGRAQVPPDGEDGRIRVELSDRAPHPPEVSSAHSPIRGELRPPTHQRPQKHRSCGSACRPPGGLNCFLLLCLSFLLLNSALDMPGGIKGSIVSESPQLGPSHAPKGKQSIVTKAGASQETSVSVWQLPQEHRAHLSLMVSVPLGHVAPKVPIQSPLPLSHRPPPSVQKVGTTVPVSFVTSATGVR